jgi:hypothetical protein
MTSEKLNQSFTFFWSFVAGGVIIITGDVQRLVLSPIEVFQFLFVILYSLYMFIVVILNYISIHRSSAWCQW